MSSQALPSLAAGVPHVLLRGTRHSSAIIRTTLTYMYLSLRKIPYHTCNRAHSISSAESLVFDLSTALLLRQHGSVLFATCGQAEIHKYKYCEWNHPLFIRISTILHFRFITVGLAALSLGFPDVLQFHDDLWSGCIPVKGVNCSTSAVGELSALFCAVLTNSDAAVVDILYVDGSFS